MQLADHRHSCKTLFGSHQLRPYVAVKMQVRHAECDVCANRPGCTVEGNVLMMTDPALSTGYDTS